jgi:hypothetical protein
VAELLSDRNAHSSMLKEKLTAAQNRTKVQADKQRTDRIFAVGDMVLLKLQPYAQQSVVNQPCPKLAFKYFGPFKVIQCIVSVPYKLELPAHAQEHPVFHVSQLKPFTPNYTPAFAELPQLAEQDRMDVEHAAIVDCRMVKKGNHSVPQVLIRWTHLPQEATTWEDYFVVKQHFPKALTWGQASSEVGGDVKTGGSVKKMVTRENTEGEKV